ncbi:hypothetical protein O181_082635 [Austropuccinia psidii MF-1]|uniref:CCHC-type domain-containing protein n=1 Tax=Austropuccinia psidii MF-1 TaxID=1389203 RepID=A0A9Q3IL15_9BASI|nr:hypothetical protein [Austropuccinia psidii MF-1]
MPGELEHAVKCRCNQNLNLEEIANNLQEVSKRTNIRKFNPYKSSGFKEKKPSRVEFKEKPKERVAEMEKKKNACHNCGSTDHYANNCPKAKKKEYPTEDYESESMGDEIRDKSDDYQDPREEFLAEYQEETPLEIQEIQLEAGMHWKLPKRTCANTQDAQTFLITPKKRNGIYTWNSHKDDLARNYLANHFPNWVKQLFPTKAKTFKGASGEMTSIGTIIKEMIIPHRKGNLRLNPEFLELDDAHIQGFLLGTDYLRMYGVDI